MSKCDGPAPQPPRSHGAEPPAVGDDAPSILPLHPPRPILEFGKMFVLPNGYPIQAIGQRWRSEDKEYAPVPTEPDPRKPEHALALYLWDPVRQVILSSVSADVFFAALEAADRPVIVAHPGILGRRSDAGA